MKDKTLEDIAVKQNVSYSSSHVQNGVNIPAIKRIEIFSPAEWEEFTEEWSYSLKPRYVDIKRLSGSGDQGRDVIGFCDEKKFNGVYDQYQCKYYNDKLKPSDVWIEIGKLIYHTYQDGIEPPRKFYFVSPKGVGLKLSKILLTDQIKTNLKEKWDESCGNKIEVGTSICLEGDLLLFFDNFDFSIFGWITAAQLVEGHVSTPFHVTRFGGGLPPVLNVVTAPEQIQDTESRYVTQLLEAYSDNKKEQLTSVEHLESHSDIKDHFTRSRESFYSAESLRNFARDNVPPGTFESLQNDVYYGVIDTCEMDYKDGLERVRKTTSKATDLPLANNPLESATSPKNKQGICHQLSNEDRLIWVKKK